MKRFVLASLVLLGSAVAPAAAHASASNLKGFVCQTASSPGQRAMSITAVMRPIPGTAKMAMRFKLLERGKRYGPTTSVAGTGLKSWLTPKDPTLGSRPGDEWIVKHPVVDLAAPAYYRFRITFRWLDSGGGTVGQRTRQTPICFQPQLEPDLKVTQGWASPSTPGVYSAVIRNAGATASSEFNVDVSSTDGSLAHSEMPLASLAPHTGRMVKLTGKPCTAGEPLMITVIPEDAMDDSSSSDNMVTATCPAPAAAPAVARHGR
jgi:hypothetical protein